MQSFENGKSPYVVGEVGTVGDVMLRVEKSSEYSCNGCYFDQEDGRCLRPPSVRSCSGQYNKGTYVKFIQIFEEPKSEQVSAEEVLKRIATEIISPHGGDSILNHYHLEFHDKGSNSYCLINDLSKMDVSLLANVVANGFNPSQWTVIPVDDHYIVFMHGNNVQTVRGTFAQCESAAKDKLILYGPIQIPK